MSSHDVVGRATRVGWEYFMDGIAVALSGLIRFALFPTNIYVDGQRLSSSLERIRRMHLYQRDIGEPICKELHDDDYFIIDARRVDEFAESHLYGAINCHYSSIAKIEEIFQQYNVKKTQPIVVYCAVGLRSGWFARKLRKRGYKKASVLYGGYYHWGMK